MATQPDAFIERRIIIGLIVSTDYVQKIKKLWSLSYLNSRMAKLISTWCLEYYDKYSKAPFSDIEGIYLQKLKDQQISQEIAEEIEEDLLPNLSTEYEREGHFNVDYLVDQTQDYFRSRNLELFSESIKALVQQNDLAEAEKLAAKYSFGPEGMLESGIFLDSDEALDCLESAFQNESTPLITYPGSLGIMLNSQLVRGGFVAFLSPEKRGKSYLLLDLAIRAIRAKSNVVFFQAGDMTKNQQLRRISIYLAKKSDKEKYCGEQFVPVKDCILNQLDLCNRPERECGFGVFSEVKEDEYWKKIDFEKLIDAYKDEKDYLPCQNCTEDFKGAVWYESVKIPRVLKAKEARRKTDAFFKKYKNRFLLSTHANGTLSVDHMKTLLDTWERTDNFVPDVIIADYADILVNTERIEFRHRQNEIWKGLRSLSQERHALVLTATQADAASYEQNRLHLRNFSEDKRKYAHVTAMYGLNQDPKGVEKQLGIMRINELVVREDEFNSEKEVKILQRLQIGRPYLGSFT